ILRRLAEDGLGNINYNVWKYPYIFTCNQLPVFSVGRLAIYSLLEKQSGWGHLKPYTDLAFAELNESLAHNFLPDGGFPEGTGYLAYTLDNALPALAIYASARNKPFAELLPPLLAKTDDYIEALRSTERPTQLILVSDAQGGPYAPMSASVLSVMTKIRPGGASARILAAFTPAQRQGMDLWALPAPDLTGVDPNFYEPFVLLPDNGIAASTRKSGEILTKLLVIGGPAKAGHNHEDRGSFVLEFAGETFAADPGGLTYSDAMAQTMKHAQNHNMLVPIVKSGKRPAAKNPATVAVIPEAAGDANAFNATIDGGVLWPDFYKSWKRSFTSPSYGEITIKDDYELTNGDGVEFLWHTPLPVKNENGQVIISGSRGRAVITPPAGTTVEITPSRKLGMRDLSTIRFLSDAKSGSLETKVLLEPAK
ncbi:MAG: heparinase II/III family protein, partial [Verrucomicrobiota bacterium]